MDSFDGYFNALDPALGVIPLENFRTIAVTAQALSPIYVIHIGRQFPQMLHIPFERATDADLVRGPVRGTCAMLTPDDISAGHLTIPG